MDAQAAQLTQLRLAVRRAEGFVGTKIDVVGVGLIVISIVILAWRHPIFVVLLFGVALLGVKVLCQVQERGLLGLVFDPEKTGELALGEMAKQSIYDTVVIGSLERLRMFKKLARVGLLIANQNLTREEINYIVQNDQEYLDLFRQVVGKPLVHYLPGAWRRLLFGDLMVRTEPFLHEDLPPEGAAPGSAGRVSSRSTTRSRAFTTTLTDGGDAQRRSDASPRFASAQSKIFSRSRSEERSATATNSSRAADHDVEKGRLLPRVPDGDDNSDVDKDDVHRGDEDTTAAGEDDSASSPSVSNASFSPGGGGRDELLMSAADDEKNSSASSEDELIPLPEIVARVVNAAVGFYTSSFMSSEYVTTREWERHFKLDEGQKFMLRRDTHTLEESPRRRQENRDTLLRGSDNEGVGIEQKFFEGVARNEQLAGSSSSTGRPCSDEIFEAANDPTSAIGGVRRRRNQNVVTIDEEFLNDRDDEDRAAPPPPSLATRVLSFLSWAAPPPAGAGPSSRDRAGTPGGHLRRASSTISSSSNGRPPINRDSMLRLATHATRPLGSPARFMFSSILEHTPLPEMISEEERKKAVEVGAKFLQRRIREVEDVKTLVARKQAEANARNTRTKNLLDANFDISVFFWMRMHTWYKRYLERHVFQAVQLLSGFGIAYALKGIVHEKGKTSPVLIQTRAAITRTSEMLWMTPAIWTYAGVGGLCGYFLWEARRKLDGIRDNGGRSGDSVLLSPGD
mmetsp:Transcript_22239/g.56126  ORF Transcript_22239/g.56126 Transcript_22239/m.56126 type:complete len:739 (+) Transcript_22239:570-2786(+)